MWGKCGVKVGFGMFFWIFKSDGSIWVIIPSDYPNILKLWLFGMELSKLTGKWDLVFTNAELRLLIKVRYSGEFEFLNLSKNIPV